MHNRLPPKGMCSWSHDLMKFWEITNDVLEMVQDRDVVTTEIMCSLSNGTNANDFE